MSALLAAAACLLAGLPARGEEPFRDWLSEEKTIWTAPLRVNRTHAPWIAGFAAATVGLIALDKHISHGLPDSPAQLRWGGRVSRSGSFYGLLGLSGGMYLAGKAGHRTRLQQAGAASAEAVVHAFVVTYGLKLAFGRERPGTGSGDGHFWKAYDRAWKGDTSFPSGHALTSWAAASAIAHQYRDNKWVPWLAYGFASAVSGARVAAKKHHASDVFAGGAAGFLIGRMVSGKFDGKHAALRPQVAPVFDAPGRTAELRLIWAWR